MTDKPLTMGEWIFKPDTPADTMRRLGFGGFVLAALVTNAIKQITPSVGVTCLVCLAFALLLAIPVVIGDSPHRDSTVKRLSIALAGAYLWIALLYFFSWTNLIILPSGYDAATDLVGTLFFVGAWFILSVQESDKQDKASELCALTVLCLLVSISGISKLVLDFHQGANEADHIAARLMLNICNGAIFLSLYGQMRRLLPPPDPVSHIIILLFGCAQIAAHGRDCLTASTRCLSPSVAWVSALVIAWTLLLGKIAFGTYVSYLYFNGHLRNRRY